MSNNLAPIIEELRRAYTVIKKEVFDPKFAEKGTWELTDKGYEFKEYPNAVTNMPMPIITIQARGRKHVDGWYKPAAWESEAADAINVLAGKDKGTIASTDEICIAAEALASDSEQILTILTHQMVHHLANHNKRGRTQNENGYHNENFKSLASTVGLDAQADGSRGFADTRVGGYYQEELKETFKNVNLDETLFDIFRKENATDKKFVGSKLKKWQCKCTNIRAAVYVEMHCLMCDTDFVYVDKDKDEAHIQEWLDSEKKKADSSARHWGNRAARRRI